MQPSDPTDAVATYTAEDYARYGAVTPQAAPHASLNATQWIDLSELLPTNTSSSPFPDFMNFGGSSPASSFDFGGAAAFAPDTGYGPASDLYGQAYDWYFPQGQASDYGHLPDAHPAMDIPVDHHGTVAAVQDHVQTYGPPSHGSDYHL
jgi:hypothetical protein